MIRITDALLIVAAIAGAAWTYQIKHEAELSGRRLAELRSDIAAQENKITLLQAGWAIMTSPSRLEKIASNYLDDLELDQLKSTQIISLDELPPIRPKSPSERIQVDRENTGDDADIDMTSVGSINADEQLPGFAPSEITIPTRRAVRGSE